MAKFLLISVWDNKSELVPIKHGLDNANTVMLLAVAVASLLVAFNVVTERRKRIIEIVGAILAIILVFTSQYLSPAIADRLSDLKLLPRHITEKQRAKFIVFLKDAPKGPVLVRANELDAEVSSYTDEIRSLLDAAGYTGDAETNMGERILSTTSIALAIKSERDAPSYTLAIQKAFATIGIDAQAVLPRKDDVAPFAKSGEIYVFVNRNP